MTTVTVQHQDVTVTCGKKSDFFSGPVTPVTVQYEPYESKNVLKNKQASFILYFLSTFLPVHIRSMMTEKDDL